MSNFFQGKMFAKISELDETVEFDTADEFVVVKDRITQKISGQDLTESIVSIGNLASKAYVDAVVDGAPELLNTLNEIAAALNDDSNFASNIINSIATKLPTANFGLEFWSALEGVNTFHIAEGSNLYYTQARFDAALAAKTTADVTEGTNLYYTEQRVLDVVIPLVPTSIFDLDVPEVSVNLPGYLHYNGTTLSWESSTKTTSDVTEGDNLYFTEQRVLDVINSLPPDPADRLINGVQEVVLGADGTLTLPADPTSDSHAATKGYVDSQFNSFESFSGDYNDLTNKPTLFSKLSSDLTWNVYTTEAELPNAAAKHGMFAHVHGTGHGYMAHAGNWIKLANYSDILTAPTFTTVTTTQLNVQNVTFTGSGPVSFTSGNDLNFVSAGVIAFNSTVSLGADGKLTLLSEPTNDNHAATKGYVDNQITDVVAGQGFATLDYVEDAITSTMAAARTEISTEIDTAIDSAITTARTAISTEISTAIDTAELDGGTF